jgi:hypothetical protein
MRRAALCALTAAAGGCGGTDPRASVAPPVSTSQVRDAGGLRTPEGAVTKAWRAVQRDDVGGLHRTFAPGRVTRAKVVEMLAELSPLVPKGMVVVRRVTERGERARVDALVRLVTFGEDEDVVTEIETIFVLRRVGHEWRLVETGFLTDRVRRVEARSRRAAR